MFTIKYLYMESTTRLLEGKDIQMTLKNQEYSETLKNMVFYGQMIVFSKKRCFEKI